MAGWISATREADRLSVEENIDMEYNDDDELPELPWLGSTQPCVTKWVNMTLAGLFGGLPKRTVPTAANYVIPAHIQEEIDEMEALADQSEDEYLDDGAQEGSGDNFEE